MTTQSLSEEVVTTAMLAGLAHDFDEVDKNLNGGDVCVAVSTLINMLLLQRADREYRPVPKRHTEDFLTGLTCLSQELARKAVMAMDEGLQVFMGAQYKDSFMADVISAGAHEANERAQEEKQRWAISFDAARRSVQKDTPTQE